MSENSIISLQNVNKWFGDFHVLQDVNLEVKKKERIVVCGPSGSGKSTMIRCINRLEEHQEGTIIVDGIELTGNLKNIDSVRKEVGMVFQQFNLFPHLSVKENITLLCTPNKQANSFSRVLKKMFPNKHKFIFCNTGTEAMIKALRICHAITDKNLILSAAVPFPPAMIAPAWPILLPGGAV